MLALTKASNKAPVSIIIEIPSTYSEKNESYSRSNEKNEEEGRHLREWKRDNYIKQLQGMEGNQPNGGHKMGKTSGRRA